jgi:hypothetical protein
MTIETGGPLFAPDQFQLKVDANCDVQPSNGGSDAVISAPSEPAPAVQITEDNPAISSLGDWIAGILGLGLLVAPLLPLFSVFVRQIWKKIDSGEAITLAEQARILTEIRTRMSSTSNPNDRQNLSRLADVVAEYQNVI